MHVVVDLPVASFLVDQCAVRVHNVDRRAAAMGCRIFEAGLGDLLCRRAGNLVAIKNVRSILARHDVFVRQGRMRSLALR